MAALVSGAPWLMPVDDHVAAALRRLAARCPHPLLRRRLTDAVSCRRSFAGRLTELTRKEADRIEAGFEAIIGLSRRLDAAGAPQLAGGPLGRLVADLSRAEVAIGRRSALSDQADPLATAELEQVVDGIEAEAAALAEVARLDGHRYVRQ